MPGLYFEQATPGLRIAHRLHRTVTEADNVMFCAMTHNNQPLHLDHEYARTTEFGQPVVNSLYTVSLATGISIDDTTDGTLVANLGFGNMTFPKPVFVGDTLKVETEVLSARESKSRPNAGIVAFAHEVTNQRDELVCRLERTALLQRQVSSQ